MWGVTTQNEPKNGLVPAFPFNSMGWTPPKMLEWIRDFLGPTFHENGLEKVKIMTVDDDNIYLRWWADNVRCRSLNACFVYSIKATFVIINIFCVDVKRSEGIQLHFRHGATLVCK
jgi:O-glycosyl hydrolase